MPSDTDEAKVVQSQMDNMSLESQVGFWWGRYLHDFTKKSVELDVMQNFTHKLDGIVIIGEVMSFILTT